MNQDLAVCTVCYQAARPAEIALHIRLHAVGILVSGSQVFLP